jgi:hypothetical protein
MLVDVPCVGQLHADVSIAEPFAGLRVCSPPPLGQRDSFPPKLGMRFAAADFLAGLHSLALRPLRSLATRRPFFMLGKGAGDLEHHLSSEIVAVGEIVAGRGEQPDVSLGQQGDAKLLHDQLAGRSGWRPRQSPCARRCPRSCRGGRRNLSGLRSDRRRSPRRHSTRRRPRTLRAWRRHGWPHAGVCRNPYRRRHWRPTMCAGRQQQACGIWLSSGGKGCVRVHGCKAKRLPAVAGDVDAPCRSRQERLPTCDQLGRRSGFSRVGQEAPAVIGERVQGDGSLSRFPCRPGIVGCFLSDKRESAASQTGRKRGPCIGRPAALRISPINIL